MQNTYLLLVLLLITGMKGYGQANNMLSNLQSPTAVNQSLLPRVDSTIDLGSSSRAWKSLFLNNRLYMQSYLTMHTVGEFSFFAGTLAGNTTMTGDVNTGIGSFALYKNKSGSFNTAVGYLAMGYNTDGHNNTAIGNGALNSNKGGYYNVAVGSGALGLNNEGYGNTATGLSSMLNNTTGNLNTATGMFSLHMNTTGSFNTAYGVRGLEQNTEGIGNTASGHASMWSNTTGSYNTAYGEDALSFNESGNFNTALGYSTDVQFRNLYNATAIGANTNVYESNSVRIGSLEVTSVGGQVGWTTFSDGRFKRNIQENIPGLVFINNLRPVSYTVDVQSLNAYNNKENKSSGDSIAERFRLLKQRSLEAAANVLHDGFVAQEVEAAATKAGFAFSGVDKPKSEDGLYGLRYDHFVVPLVKAVQELSRMNDTLRKEHESLRKEMNELKTLVLAISSGINQPVRSSSDKIANENHTQNITLTTASLEQNIPNPFTSSTTIPYTLPQQYHHARIIITDQHGKTLKQVKLSGFGKGTVNIDARTLASGAYNYSLVIDGQVIGTRQMLSNK